ncbi:Helicase/SANT-associated [Heracleum sosnowskyi]|uniref:Helicase/SANT-associated n=1 Tax=Heracleum sosnowskyi TaxID=360622 RepID=A0AAD8LV93_9APIA|nr:Helicase/SANT-associated [Heracleum sosnowskyi]
MRGYTLGFGHLVNADDGSMGVVDHKGGVPTDIPPQLTVIEETTSEIKQRFVSHEEAKRQLDFLEEGGDPLDFGAGNVSSLSVQSTSLMDQKHDQLGTSKAKDSLAVAASPPGNSIDSSGRPKAPLGDSAAYGLPGKAYRRKNRSRSSRDGTRSSSKGVVSSRGVHTCSPSQNATRDANRLLINEGNQKDYDACLKSILRSTSPNYNSPSKNERLSRFEVAGGIQSLHSKVDMARGGYPDANTDANACNSLFNNQHNQFSESGLGITPVNKAQSEESQEVHKRVDLGGHKSASFLAKPKVEDQVTFGQMNGLNDHEIGNAVCGTRDLDSESYCNQTSLIKERNLDGRICSNIRTGDSNENGNLETVPFGDTPYEECNKSVKETNVAKVEDTCDITNDENDSFREQEHGSILRNKALEEKVSGSLIEMKDRVCTVGVVPDAFTAQENERMPNCLLDSSSIAENGNACTSKLQVIMESSIQATVDTKLSPRVSAVLPERQNCPHVTSKLATKECEDLILKECKRITDVSVHTLSLEVRRRSHWEFVLEEMAWLANDFAQERMWKISAAAQIGYEASVAFQIKYHEQKSCRRQKEVAHNLAQAVVNFWCDIEETNKDQNLKKYGCDFSHVVQGYALRFLEYNTCTVQPADAESPMTPDRISDHGTMDMSCDTHLTEENLFFSVPTGAMEAYRKSVVYHLKFEKNGSRKEEVETTWYDTLAELGLQESAFEEKEGETTKPSLKKRKHLMKSFRARSYEMGSDSPFVQCADNEVGNFLSVVNGEKCVDMLNVCIPTELNGKRCADTLNVSVPTKRVRTAFRQRVPSHVNAETSGCVQAPVKTDASSDDITSFPDDQSTLNGGLNTPNTLEVESLRAFDKQMLYSAEISHKPKKKETKIMDSTYEQRWHMNPSYQKEQRGNNKRRLDNHQLESDGSNGLYVQQVVKKPKMMKQLQNKSVNTLHLAGGSVPSPVASQMSNMHDPNQFIKMLGVRERGRKSKTLKAPAGQPGLGSPWSLFEDQALAVLVHDMGPNWEFVSDAIGSISQCKCIIRKPKDCKERYKILMDSPAVDGADSAEGLGSSQPYRSTLPGIPKGSARQLFQHLQGPKEETTIKSHLENIIILGRKQHCRTKEPIQLQLPHNSHTFALSQVCPNNLNEGPVLTPLAMCDATTSCSDVLSLDFQSLHNGLLPISTLCNAPTITTSGVTPSVQASSDLSLNSNVSSPVPPNASVRVHADHGAHMLMSGSGVGNVSGFNKGIHMVSPGAHGIASSSMLNSSSLLSSGMVAMPNPVNMQSGLHTGPGNCMMWPRDPSHMMQPTQNLDHQRQMMISELQMQVSQGSTEGASPIGGSSSSPDQTNQTPGQLYPLHHLPYPMSSHQSLALGNPQSNQTSNSHHQVHMSRLAREKHIQQQQLLLLQQRRQYATSSALMPAVQGKSQLPLSSAQDSSQFQPQTSSPPVSLSPMTPFSKHSGRHQIPPHGAGRNPQVGGSGLTNQTGEQPPRRQPQKQQFQQAGSHHPQSQEQSRSQQHAMTSNVLGMVKKIMHNLPKKHAIVNGLSTDLGSQSEAKVNLDLHTMQGQGLYSGSGVNYVQSPKQLVTTSHHALTRQERYSGLYPHSNADNSNQNHVVSTLAATLQTVASPVVPYSKQQLSLLQPRAQSQLHAEPASNIVDQTPANLKKILDRNCQVKANPLKKQQDVKAQSDLNPVNIYSSQMGTSTSVPGSVEAANVNSLVSADVTQWEAPETVPDSHIFDQAELGSIVSPLRISSGCEPEP